MLILMFKRFLFIFKPEKEKNHKKTNAEVQLFLQIQLKFETI